MPASAHLVHAHVPVVRRGPTRRHTATLLIFSIAALAGARSAQDDVVHAQRPAVPARALAGVDRMGQAQNSPALRAADLAGLRLRTIGPANMSGRFVDMDVMESDPYVMYVASATGGVFRTRDAGITWEAVFERELVHSVGDIAIFQLIPTILWVGTGERANRQSVSWGDGVYKSTDAGKTWTNVGLRTSKHIGRIVLHPTNPDIVWVAAQGSVWGPGGDRGVYKTVDGGKTWVRTLHVDEDTGATDVAIDTQDPNILFAATYQRRRTAFGFDGGGAGSGLWKSVNGGSTWTRLSGNGLPSGDMGRIGISIYRKDPRIVYASIEQGFRYNASTAYIERRAGLYRSNDRGATWRVMSDWNPRPMYASQPTVDPNDDRRVYMLNSYSYSDNGGETFTSPRHTTHGDDRFVWINPRDSRHVIKLDDGGIGISYDRGLKFLYVQSLPVSQYYRVAVDNAHPFNVYGGLQDNGCWRGPSASWTSNGILNEHWVRLCGGDGFAVLVDPRDSSIVFSESQFLGLQRNDTNIFQAQTIRPGDPSGHISARRNWNTWGKPGASEVLGNAMHPANWDAAIMLSPHDSATIYAGGQHLFRSRDRGMSWEDLGDMTTGVDRSTLTIMGRRTTEATLSADDGVPYYPGITAIAESPRRRGVLYVGTDDGRLRMSMDDGKTWTDLQSRLPGLPPSSWIAGIEASRHADGTVYVVFDNHRSNDFRNYIYRSTDFGATWAAIAGDMTADRVLRTLREDPSNPNLLYAGAELGLWISVDGGQHWVELKNNMPTLPVYDLIIHPRDNDLVLATHGRGIWILDNVNALQGLTPQTIGSAATLFPIEPAEQIRYTNLKAHMGDMVFRGENPPNGAIIDYWIGTKAEKVSLTVHDASGALVQTLTASGARGVNRAVWNLRHADLPVRGGGGGDDDEGGGGANLPGPFVTPATYIVRLAVDGRGPQEQRVVVREDPRLKVAEADRKVWFETLMTLASTIRQAAPVNDRVQKAPGGAELADLKRQWRELMARLTGLYGEVGRWTGRPNADQMSELKFYTDMARTLTAA
ncbi:MAG: VPS10 domain-containing protein, partial [Acidobacteriota bacterium]